MSRLQEVVDPEDLVSSLCESLCEKFPILKEHSSEVVALTAQQVAEAYKFKSFSDLRDHSQEYFIRLADPAFVKLAMVNGSWFAVESLNIDLLYEVYEDTCTEIDIPVLRLHSLDNPEESLTLTARDFLPIHIKSTADGSLEWRLPDGLHIILYRAIQV